VEVVFPGKEFMIEKYSIKQPRLFWFWYPYRYYCGLKGFWYVVRGNTEKKTSPQPSPEGEGDCKVETGCKD
jgi:hypothetical protein